MNCLTHRAISHIRGVGEEAGRVTKGMARLAYAPLQERQRTADEHERQSAECGPRIKHRGAALSSRSSWRGYWYAKGVLGKWNSHAQVVEGMRWRHGLATGKDTPMFGPHEAQETAQVADGKLTDILTSVAMSIEAEEKNRLSSLSDGDRSDNANERDITKTQEPCGQREYHEALVESIGTAALPSGSGGFLSSGFAGLEELSLHSRIQNIQDEVSADAAVAGSQAMRTPYPISPLTLIRAKAIANSMSEDAILSNGFGVENEESLQLGRPNAVQSVPQMLQTLQIDDTTTPVMQFMLRMFRLVGSAGVNMQDVQNASPVTMPMAAVVQPASAQEELLEMPTVLQPAVAPANSMQQGAISDLQNIAAGTVQTALALMANLIGSINTQGTQFTQGNEAEGAGVDNPSGNHHNNNDPTPEVLRTHQHEGQGLGHPGYYGSYERRAAQLKVATAADSLPPQS